MPPLTFFATVSSVLYLGAVPVFADIDLDGLCLSPESVLEKITPKTKAIVPVHLFGAAAKMKEFVEIGAEKGIPVLEDCAQAHGSEYSGKRVGGFGAAGAFSFFATKHMTTGEGGMITTNERKLAELAKILRNHGMEGRDDHVMLGYNNRMTEMEAALGPAQEAGFVQCRQDRQFGVPVGEDRGTAMGGGSDTFRRADQTYLFLVSRHGERGVRKEHS